jgi:hypothetical protein
MKRVILLIVICLLSGTVTSFAQDGKKLSKKEIIAQKIKEQLDHNTFKVMVQWAYPLAMAPIALNSNYSLEIKNDSVFSYLPYYGRAYSIPYGGGKALNFDAPISDYSLVYPKKSKAIIKFTTKTDEDIYSYTINIFMNGNTDIIVNSQNRQSINFQGDAVVDLQKPGVNKQ